MLEQHKIYWIDLYNFFLKIISIHYKYVELPELNDASTEFIPQNRLQEYVLAYV